MSWDWSTPPVSNTCPRIDEAISTVGDINNDLSSILKRLQEFEYYLENLRDENRKLREWGLKNGTEAQEYCDKVYELEKRIERNKELHEDEISDLKSEIESLYDHINN